MLPLNVQEPVQVPALKLRSSLGNKTHIMALKETYLDSE